MFYILRHAVQIRTVMIMTLMTLVTPVTLVTLHQQITSLSLSLSLFLYLLHLALRKWRQSSAEQLQGLD